MYAGDKKYNILDEQIVINSVEKKDNWLCFYLKDMLPDTYAFRFIINLDNSFTEVQFAFKYDNLGMRYGFLLRDNKELAFEVAYNGEFYNHIISKTLHLEIGQAYDIKVAVMQNGYAFYLDDKCEMFVSEKQGLSRGKDACIILWNFDDSAPVRCTISKFRLIKLR